MSFASSYGSGAQLALFELINWSSYRHRLPDSEFDVFRSSYRIPSCDFAQQLGNNAG